MRKFMKRLALMYLALTGAVVGDFSMAANCPQLGFTIVEVHATSETRPVRWGNQTVFVHKVPLTKTSDIASIKVVSEGKMLDGPDDALIRLTFTPMADQKLHEATTNRSGMRIAFMLDDHIFNSVVWQGRYGMDTGGVQVSLNRGRKEAKRLPQAIRGCMAGE